MTEASSLRHTDGQDGATAGLGEPDGLAPAFRPLGEGLETSHQTVAGANGEHTLRKVGT